MKEIDLGIISERNWTSISKEDWGQLSENFTRVRRGKVETFRASLDFLYGRVETSWVYLDPETGAKYTVCFQKACGDGVRGILVKKTRTK